VAKLNGALQVVRFGEQQSVEPPVDRQAPYRRPGRDGVVQRHSKRSVGATKCPAQGRPRTQHRPLV